MDDRPIVTRFAPTPSGGLHLGSLVTACASYLFAKSHPKGLWYLRFDDLDTARNEPGSEDLIQRQLEACALLWDAAVVRQSEHAAEYRQILMQWWSQGKLFVCECSRRDLERRGALKNPWGERMYPGTCLARPKNITLPVLQSGESLRFDVCAQWSTPSPEPNEARFNDMVFGLQTVDLATQWPAPVMLRADGVVAYHLANVVDDRRMGVTHVVRGADLLGLTHLHVFLGAALSGEHRPISYGHVPVVVHESGRKLAKSDRDNLGALAQDTTGLAAARAVAQALAILGFRTTLETQASSAELLAMALEEWKALQAQMAVSGQRPSGPF